MTRQSSSCLVGLKLELGIGRLTLRMKGLKIIQRDKDWMC